jgi:membrane-associated phospholipid phosphatase
MLVLPRRSNNRHDGSVRAWMLNRIEADEAWVLRLQRHRTPALDTVNRVLSFVGGELFNVVLLPCLFWWAPLPFAVTYAFMFGSAYLVGNYVKNALALPRPRSPPVWSSSARVVSDWGFPSTHAISACLLPPYVAHYVTTEAWPALPLPLRLATYALAAVCIVGVGASRVYLGAHSLLDVAGGLACAAALGAFWWAARDAVVDAVVDAHAWPVLVAAAPLALLVLHPVSTPATPLTGDSAMLCGMASGIVLGVALRERAALHAWPHAAWPPGAAIGTTLAVAVAKFAVGTLCMLLVRAVAKRTVRTAAVWCKRQLSGKGSSSSTDSGSGNGSGGTARSSVLDETSAEVDFFLDVDLQVKYCAYLALGFVGTCGAPAVFYAIGLPL